jgi:hypothetical protein
MPLTGSLEARSWGRLMRTLPAKGIVVAPLLSLMLGAGVVFWTQYTASGATWWAETTGDTTDRVFHDLVDAINTGDVDRALAAWAEPHLRMSAAAEDIANRRVRLTQELIISGTRLRGDYRDPASWRYSCRPVTFTPAEDELMCAKLATVTAIDPEGVAHLYVLRATPRERGRLWLGLPPVGGNSLICIPQWMSPTTTSPSCSGSTSGTVDWGITIEDVRIRLKRFFPSILE